MKRIGRWMIPILAALCLPAAVRASDAQTSASAGAGLGRDVAAATARYEGDVGFARTDSRSGRVSSARGVAVGLDEDGLSLSVSQAVAPRFGPALATSLNFGIERDGDVSASLGVARADGPIYRQATAGGGAGSGRPAMATASADSDRFGSAEARTWAESSARRGAIRTQREPWRDDYAPHEISRGVRRIDTRSSDLPRKIVRRVNDWR